MWGHGGIGHNEGVATTGKRAGSRKGVAPPRWLNKSALGLCAAITVCVIAWGYLVYAAIDFGTTARDGSGSAWALMALAALGAIACLFTALLLVARLGRTLGIVAPAEPRGAAPERPARVPGGRRAAR